MAAAIGNQYAAKSKRWSDAINKALEKRSKKAGIDALEALAEKLLEKVDEGDITAIKELGDRIEGKPVQAVTNDGDTPFVVQVLRLADDSTP